MQLIITRNTSVKGASFAADPNKIITLDDDDARALIGAGKARRAPAEAASVKRSAGKAKK